MIAILLKNVGESVYSKYWPLDGFMTFGSIKVTCKSQADESDMKYVTKGQPSAKLVMKFLTVENMETEKTTDVTHLWFRAWPEFGVP